MQPLIVCSEALLWQFLVYNMKKEFTFIDILVVLLNIAAGRGNILLYWILGTTQGVWVYISVILLDVIYLMFRGNGVSIRGIRNITSVSFFLIILCVHFLSFLFNNFGSPVSSLIRLVLALLFTLILFSQTYRLLHSKDDFTTSVSHFSQGYIILSLISIVGVILSFILLNLGVDSGHPIEADFLTANIERGTTTYTRCFLSVNLISFDLRVPFFQDNGILCGLFHEPHIFALNVFPCLILLLGFVNKKWKTMLIVILAILCILFSGSTTNILVVASCLVLYGIISFRRSFIGVLLGALFVFGLVYWYYTYDDTLFQVMSSRMDTEGTSQNYSKDLLSFAFTPKTLFGTDFLSSAYVTSTTRTEDVGYIPFFLNLGFLFFYLKNIVQLLRTKEKIAIAVGIASFYYIIHSAKNGMSMYLQTLPIFLIFLQAIALYYYGRIRTVKKNS